MNTHPAPASLAPSAEGNDLQTFELQELLDEATALLGGGDVAAARDRVELAWLLHQEPRLEPILQGLENALADSHQAARACLREAEAAMEHGDLDGAETALRQAREHAPESPLVLNALGWFLARKGDLAAAQVAYMGVLRLRPTSPSAHANLAGICLRRGLPERARELLERTLQLDPAHREARATLDRVNRMGRGAVLPQAWSLSLPSVGEACGSVWLGLSFLPALR
jgi:Tfp pilus assembly protein PilF